MDIEIDRLADECFKIKEEIKETQTKLDEANQQAQLLIDSDQQNSLL